MENRAPLKVKITFWMYLGILSTFFSEVVSFSYPFPYTTFWGVAVVWALPPTINTIYK